MLVNNKTWPLNALKNYCCSVILDMPMRIKSLAHVPAGTFKKKSIPEKMKKFV
jgi:hypothetical protein